MGLTSRVPVLRKEVSDSECLLQKECLVIVLGAFHFA